MKYEGKKLCGGCWWYDQYFGVCCCGDSEHCADFTGAEDNCQSWKAMAKGLCIFNHGVLCADHYECKCRYCGWNPGVTYRRLAKMRRGV